MRILIYGLNYAPEQVGVGKFTTEAAEWLAAQGHDVSVVAAAPHYPEWQLPDGYTHLRYRRERAGGVDVVRCPLWLPREMTSLKRVLCCLSFVATSFVPLLGRCAAGQDILIVIEPTFFAIPPAWLLGRLFRIPVWLHVQDFELEAALGLGMVRGGVLQRAIRALERVLLRRLHRVSTLTVGMDRHLQALGVVAARRVLFPNWVDCTAIHPLPGHSCLRSELRIAPDSVVLLYAGSLGRKHGLELLVRLARELREESALQLVVAGEGVERPVLERAAAELPNLHLLPLQPAERLNELLNLADIHLLPQRASVADAVLPSKLTGMLASGRPVVATAEPDTELARIVVEAGIVTPPGDVFRMADAVRALAYDLPRRRALGRRARAYAEAKLHRDVVLREFEQALQACVDASPVQRASPT